MGGQLVEGDKRRLDRAGARSPEHKHLTNVLYKWNVTERAELELTE